MLVDDETQTDWHHITGETVQGPLKDPKLEIWSISFSLDSSGERVGSFKPLPLGLITYTFADIRNQLYLGTLPQNIAQGQLLVEAGVRHDLLDGTILRTSVIPISPIKQETWKDPFSNINFYESTNYLTALGIGYNF